MGEVMGSKYIELLERSYKEHCSFFGECSRLDFLTENIFDVTTYNSGISEDIGVRLIQVAEAITRRETYEYIADKENHLWYIACVNFPFFKNKITWGCSIRGAWWDITDVVFSTCALFDEKGNQKLDWTFSDEEWKEFTLSFRPFVESAE
jgi:hypothetical protein